MPCVLQDPGLRPRRLARQPARGPRIAVVQGPGEGEQGELEASEQRPDGLEHPLAGGSQERGEGPRVLCEPARALGIDRRSDWSANSGWRSQIRTTSSICAVSIHAASRSSASARAERVAALSMPALAPTVTSAA